MHGTKGSRSSWNPERNIAVDQLPDRLPAVIRYVNKVDPEQEEQFAAVTYLLGEDPGFPVIPK